MNDSQRTIVGVGLLAFAAAMGLGAFDRGTAPTPSDVTPAAGTKSPYVLAFERAKEGTTREEMRVGAAEARLFFATVAEGLRFDGNRAKPFYVTYAQADDFSVNVKAFFLGGKSFGERFPELGPVVAAELRAVTPEDLFTPLDRARFVQALDRIAAGCAEAERRL